MFVVSSSFVCFWCFFFSRIMEFFISKICSCLLLFVRGRVFDSSHHLSTCLSLYVYLICIRWSMTISTPTTATRIITPSTIPSTSCPRRASCPPHPAASPERGRGGASVDSSGMPQQDGGVELWGGGCCHHCARLSLSVLSVLEQLPPPLLSTQFMFSVTLGLDNDAYRATYHLSSLWFCLRPAHQVVASPPPYLFCTSLLLIWLFLLLWADMDGCICCCRLTWSM